MTNSEFKKEALANGIKVNSVRSRRHPLHLLWKSQYEYTCAIQVLHHLSGEPQKEFERVFCCDNYKALLHELKADIPVSFDN